MTPCELCGTVHGPRQAHAFGRARERLQGLSSDPVCTKCQVKDVELALLRRQVAELEQYVDELIAVDKAVVDKPVDVSTPPVDIHPVDKKSQRRQAQKEWVAKKRAERAAKSSS